MRTALLQGLTPGTQECAQAPRDRASWSRAWAPSASVRGVTPLAPRDRASWSRAWAPSASVRGVTPLVPGLRPIHSVVL